MAHKDKSIEVRHETVPSEMMTHRKDAIKFGIRTPFRESDKGELVFLTPEQPILDVLKIVCDTWGFPDPTAFALKFSEPPCHYVTDATRKELSGKLVNMYHSPAKVCSEIIAKLTGGNEKDIKEGLKELSTGASDPTLADMFVSMDGLSHLLELIEKDKLNDKEMGLSFALQALLDIMLTSDNATWDKLHAAVISKVCSYVNSPKGMDKAALGPALQVLENAVSSGSAYSQVEKEVTLGILVTHVQNPDPKVQQNALALVNALFGKADLLKRKTLAGTLASRKYRDIVLQFVINKKPGDRPSETNHELYVMQTLFLNLLEERRQTPVDPNDQDSLNKIKDLFRIAFDSDAGSYSSIGFETNNLSNGGKRDKSNHKRDFQKLGFTVDSTAALDFVVAPPGTLALDCMHHLATNHQEIYSKIVLESACRSSGDECPFAKSSMVLINLLCDIMKMGEPPGDQQGKFYPFYFQHDKPFEELYCICAQLVTKTWKEMRATMEDFDKVFDVVREQIRRALDKIPETFEALRNSLNALTYQEITNLRQQERTSREEWELQAKPIQELRKKLEPEMIELIKQNRLNYLIAGTRFNKFTSRGLTLTRIKEKFWFCRLSNNGKVFHYGDCDEKATPLPEELSSKLNVIDIKDLLTGKDCPHMKDSKGKKSNVPLAFSLVTEKETMRTVDFVAPDEKTFDLWTDGINALLGKEMVSKEAKKDLDVLLHMEIKLRLLDIEGIPEIHRSEPPEIPELPTNFDFSGLHLNGVFAK